MDDTESQKKVGNSDHFKFALLTGWPDRLDPLNFWQFRGYNWLSESTSMLSIVQRTLELLEWKLLGDFSKSIINVVSKDT